GIPDATGVLGGQPMQFVRVSTAALAAAALASTWASRAAAQDQPMSDQRPQTTTQPTVVQQPAPVVQAPAPVVVQQNGTEGVPPRGETVETGEKIPNGPLITTGVIVFGAPWVASAIVSAESTHQGDNHLWIPIVGPWLDFADR